MYDLPTISTESGRMICHVPMTLKKRAGRREIVAPSGVPLEEPGASAYQEALVIAIARGFRWKRLLDAGTYTTISELAAAVRMDKSQVMRILRLTLLAPDIIEAIIAGREPSGLSLERLYHEFPLLWEEQREALGFRSG